MDLVPITLIRSGAAAAEPPPGIRVALVAMPWGSVRKPALATALLKKCIQNAGYLADLHHLNIRFAERLGLHLYEEIIDRGHYQPEWFFAQALFGPQGLREMQNGWDDITLNPSCQRFADGLKTLMAGSELLCERIANEEVPRFIDDCLEQVDWGSYAAVGFTTTFAQSLASLLLAKRIKDRFPAVKIILGGANVDGEMGVEFMSGFEWIDYVVHGEAETSLPSLLNNIAANRPGEKIPGVTVRRGSEIVPGDKDPKPLISMNDAVVPDYSDYVRELERTGFGKKFDLRLWFESSRGCWWGAKHHCTFCGLNATEMSYRKKSPERVYSEIKYLSEQYRCLSFCATDSILALEYFAQLLPKLAEMNADLHFFYEIKANLTREQVKKLHAAGIREIQPGIESFCSRLLQLMRKGVTAIQNIQLVKWCYEFDISPSYNILYGFPGEGPDDYKDLPRICQIMSHLNPPDTIGPVVFERFSPYHFDKDKFGLTLKPIDLYQFIFPESRVELSKIAYCFEGEWHGQNGDPKEYMKPCLEAVEKWQQQWKHQKTFCYYAKGPNYIIIYDNRPKAEDITEGTRQIYLDEHVSTLYQCCDQISSFQTICDMMKDKFVGKISAEQVRTWLDQLVLQGFIFQEGERYLALAVHKRPSSSGRPLRPGQFELSEPRN